MTLNEKWNNSTGLKIICSLLLNALFLAAALLIMPPVFEANDDLTLAAFADGQMAVKCTYIPYINYVLALLLNGIYRLLGESIAWHTVPMARCGYLSRKIGLYLCIMNVSNDLEAVQRG